MEKIGCLIISIAGYEIYGDTASRCTQLERSYIDIHSRWSSAFRKEF